MRATKLFAALLLLAMLGNAAQVRTRTYRDPAGAFTIKLGDGWEAARERADDSWNTIISSEKHVGKLAILTIKAAPPAGTSDELKSRMLVGSSQPFFDGWLGGLKEQARVEKSSRVYRTTVGGLDAVRMDVTYYRGDRNDPRTGYAAYLLGRKNTFFISLTGSETGVAALEKILSTIEIEP
jgi:hypothetical protein